MFYEGYDIDSEGSTVNIRGRREKKEEEQKEEEEKNIEKRLYVDPAASKMNIYIVRTFEPWIWSFNIHALKIHCEKAPRRSGWPRGGAGCVSVHIFGGFATQMTIFFFTTSLLFWKP